MSSEVLASVEISYQDRIAKANLWHSRATELTSADTVPYGKEVLDFLSPAQGCTVTTPIAQDGKWGLGHKSSAIAVSVTPLADQDAKIHPYFEQLIKRLGAHYFETERSLYMPLNNMDGVMGSIVFMHEGLHAYAHSNQLWRDQPEDWSHWVEEVKTFEFEFALMREAGGITFDETVVNWAPVVAERLIQGIGSDKELHSGLQSNDLEQAIDPNMSFIEKGYLSSALMIAAGFYGINGSLDIPNDITSHAGFVRWIYNVPLTTENRPKLLQQ